MSAAAHSPSPAPTPVKAARITRTQCDRYDLRLPNHSWAIITLGEPGGVLQILSDWGAWGYAWPNHGDPSFRHFLVRMSGSPDYLVGKLTRGRKDDFDLPATMVRIRQLITARVQKWSGKICDAKMLAALESIGEEYGRSAGAFVAACLCNDQLHWLYQHVADGLAVCHPDGACVGFVREVWPHFVEELRLELSGGGESRG